MKLLLIKLDGATLKTECFPMVSTPDAYIGGGDGFGYVMEDSNLFARYTPGNEGVEAEGIGEYLSVDVQMSMYEGSARQRTYLNEAEDSFVVGWVVVPENIDEANHLDEVCPRSICY